MKVGGILVHVQIFHWLECFPEFSFEPFYILTAPGWDSQPFATRKSNPTTKVHASIVTG